MRSLARVFIAAAVVATGPILSACSSSMLDSIDPTEWFDSKKKLNGDRRPVFPDGVPGVTTGVPADLVRGYHHEMEGGIPDPAKEAAEAAAGADHPSKPPPQRTATTRKSRPNNNSHTTAAQQPPPQQPPPQQPPPSSQGGWGAPQQPPPWPGSR